LSGLEEQFVQGELTDAGHREDGPPHLASAPHEQGKDELGGVEAGFADHLAQGGRAAQTSGPIFWKLSDERQTHADILSGGKA
jgi:hypothetical protein